MNQGFDKEELDPQSPFLPPVDLGRERAHIGVPLLAMAFIFLFSGVAQIILYAVTAVCFPALASLEGYATVLSAVSLYGISMPLSLLIYRIVPPCAPQRRRLSALTLLGLFCVAVSLTYVGNQIGILVNEGISLLTGEPQRNEFAESVVVASFWEILIVFGFLAPIMEELFFRKAVVDRIAHYGDLPAILISGIAFGLIHGNVSQFFYAAIVGGLFSYIYLRTGKIRYTMLLHVGVNLFGTVYTSEMVRRMPTDLSTSEPLGAYLSSVGGVMFLAYLGFIALCFVGAVVTVALLWKHIRLRRGERRLRADQWVRILLLNPATLIFLIVTLMLFF